MAESWKARRCEAGVARQGVDWPGRARQSGPRQAWLSRRGAAWQGVARPGRARQARRGVAGREEAEMSEARDFTFGELWSLAMEDEDFAVGRISAAEFFRRLKGGVMGKGLYRVRIEADMYVYADSPEEAESVAEDHWRDELGNLGPDLFASRQPVSAVPGEWCDAIPYGDGVNDRTCEQILRAGAP